jgi:hypothetical protein
MAKTPRRSSSKKASSSSSEPLVHTASSFSQDASSSCRVNNSVRIRLTISTVLNVIVSFVLIIATFIYALSLFKNSESGESMKYIGLINEKVWFKWILIIAPIIGVATMVWQVVETVHLNNNNNNNLKKNE